MVRMLEGSGCEAHRSLILARTHTRSSSPSRFPIHSLTLCDALLHSSLPGAAKKARETHKSKLKCSSECFLDVMHGSWDAAWPCCLPHKCAGPQIHKHKSQSVPKTLLLSLAYYRSSLLQNHIFSPDLHIRSVLESNALQQCMRWFDELPILATSCQGLIQQGSGPLEVSFQFLLPAATSHLCRTGSSSLLSIPTSAHPFPLAKIRHWCSSAVSSAVLKLM